MITHLEPDILDSEVKWALGIIIILKASGRNRIPAKLFKILKDYKTLVKEIKEDINGEIYCVHGSNESI